MILTSVRQLLRAEVEETRSISTTEVATAELGRKIATAAVRA